MKQPTNIINRILENRILAHTLFWLGSILFFVVYAKGFGMPVLVSFIIKVFFLPVQILATYYLVYYQIPTFIYAKRYFRFFISLFLSALFFCTLAHFIDDFGIARLLKGYSNNIHTFWEILSNPFANLGYNAQDIYLTVFIATGIKFIKQRLDEKTKLNILEQEKVQAEIDYLKAQVNPRILASSLKQLYKLTKDKSDAAPEVVIKLSDMLDYMLYRCNEPKVLISKEIELIQNYLDLKKIQFGDRLKIHFYHELENKFAEISPLLLLSIVELFFMDEHYFDDAQELNIEILLKEKKNQLSLKTHSNLHFLSNTSDSNLRKQLDLIYPNDYTFNTTKETTGSTSTLILDLQAASVASN